MLWRVGDSGFHLVGSCHVLQTSDYPISSVLDKAYQDSRLVAFESDMLAPEVQAFGFSNGKATLLSVAPELYEAVEVALAVLGQDISSLPRSKPWHASLRLGLAIIANEGFTADYGLDLHFCRRAYDDSKSVSFLESPCAALTCFDSAPVVAQLALLRYGLANRGWAVREIHRIIEGWRTSNEEELELVLNERLHLFPDLFGCLIPARNLRWLPNVLHLSAQRTPTLLSVGILHCVGQQGLPALLAERGVVVSRIQ